MHVELDLVIFNNMRFFQWKLGCALLIFCATSCESKGVSVSLTASWKGAPLVLEAAEFLADESPRLFWEYVDKLGDAGKAFGGAKTGGSCWEKVHRLASEGLSKGLTSVLGLSLAVREYTAKVEMMRQIAQERVKAGEESCCWAQVDGKRIVRDVKELEKSLNGSRSSTSREEVHKFDHVYPKEMKEDVPIVVLYGAPGTKCFSDLHGMLSGKGRDGEVVYVLRLVAGEVCDTDYLDTCAKFGIVENLPLSGFGVEMALKSTEYSAVDDKKGDEEGKDTSKMEVGGFLFEKLVERKPHLKQELLTFRDHLVSMHEEGETLKVWQMKDLGMQTSQRILQAADSIGLMTEISQNFPSLVASLSRFKVDSDFQEEVREISQYMSQKLNLVLLNGAPVDISDFDILDFLKSVRVDVRAIDQLLANGVDSDVVLDLLGLRNYDKSKKIKDMRYDLWSKGDVIYFNNLESDALYSTFHKSVESLLSPYYRDDLVPIAKNLLTAVFVVDMSSKSGMELGRVVQEMFSDLVPIRFGLFPVTASSKVTEFSKASTVGKEWEASSVGERTIRLFLAVKEAFGVKPSLEFWGSLKTYATGNSNLTPDDLEKAFLEGWVKFSRSAESKRARSAAQITPSDALSHAQSSSGFAAELVNQIVHHRQVAIKRGLHLVSEAHLWLNGVMYGVGFSNFKQQIIDHAFSEKKNLQERVYYGHISFGTTNTLKALLKRTNTAGRYNQAVMGVGQHEKPRIVPLDLIHHQGLSDFLYLVNPKHKDLPKLVTHWLVLDFESMQGSLLLKEAVDFLVQQGDSTRLAVLSNRQMQPDEKHPVNWLERLWYSLLSPQANIPGLAVLWKHILGEEEFLKELQDLAGTDDGVDGVAIGLARIAKQAGTTVSEEKVTSILMESSEEIMGRLVDEESFCSTVLEISGNSLAVVTNGRIVEMHKETEHGFMFNDFATMDVIASELQMGNLILSTLLDNDEDLDATSVSNQVSIITPVLQQAKVEMQFSSDVMGRIQDSLEHMHATKIVSGSQTSPGSVLIKLDAVLNPVSKEAQKISQLLDFIRSSLNPHINVYLNTPLDLSEMPLKQYYRFALPALEYTEDGFLLSVSPPSSYFSTLPFGKVLTANPDVPKAWLVGAVDAELDMDNLQMEELGTKDVLFVEYRLESLLLTGSCENLEADSKSGSYPQGAQLVLTNEAGLRREDTLVMSNLGYYQLKALPGLWYLKLAPGRSDDIYVLESSSDFSATDAEEALSTVRNVNHRNEALVHMDSLAGRNIGLKLRKKPGMELESVLDGAEDGAGLLDKWLTWFKGNTQKTAHNDVSFAKSCQFADDPINIFTIASGHMYERLQKIMVLSVLKSTKSCVKFWFIKNYMSPQMKDFLPHFAKKYGFKYGLITYKWPSWLNHQTEKQRIIWAYKILFLDVLFPLDVPKVLFVDADQVIRTDLRELYDMNLKGAPLAYTPFCDNTKEMDGFRFWKSGFWKDHLQGKPYHISALYVVDLQKFRAMGAGDQFRIIYESLSKDPNSLANLDQDLPNYAQHSVPIFSLPQEWLWCESWCGNETMASARTIDLCNNPLTKEPKLQAARRIVEEWPLLDIEAREFTAEVERLQSSKEDLSYANGAFDTQDSCQEQETGSCSADRGSAMADNNDQSETLEREEL